jgi:hypothetical protein
MPTFEPQRRSAPTLADLFSSDPLGSRLTNHDGHPSLRKLGGPMKRALLMMAAATLLLGGVAQAQMEPQMYTALSLY